MENKIQNKPEFNRSSLHIGVRYNFIIYPVDFEVLSRVLTSQGYQVVRPTGPSGLLTSGMLEVEGTVAKKEDLTVDSLVDKQVLGVNSTDTEKLLSAFEQLEGGLSQALSINLESKARFYEIILHFSVRTGRNPLEVFSAMRKNYPYINEMSEIMGQQAAPLVYRLSPAGSPIDSENWFDFAIEPLINNATSSYHIGITYRNASRHMAIDLLKNSKNVISRSLQLLESK